MNKMSEIYGKLHLIGSPIGDMSDQSVRLQRSIKEAEYICAEDTNRFIEYCNSNNFTYSAELIDIGFSLNNDRENIVKDKIIDILKSGNDVYVISDEGMPGLADPGKFITNEAIKNNIDIVVSPGPSVVIAAAAVTNILNNFIFEGFMSHIDNDRYSRFKFLQSSEIPMIFLLNNPNSRPIDTDQKVHVSYNCSDYNIFIDDAILFFGENRHATLCIDLTTKKQQTIRGSLKYIKDYTNNNFILGNLCIVIDGINNRNILI